MSHVKHIYSQVQASKPDPRMNTNEVIASGQRHCRHLRRRVPERRNGFSQAAGWVDDPLADCWAFDGGGLLYIHCYKQNG
jgi:hypothetical protein